MGYLKRKLRRGRSPTIRQPQTLEGNWVWERAPARLPAPGNYFLRFGVSDRTGRLGQPLGVFKVAGIHRRSAAISEEDLKQLSRALRWFNRNLPAPSTVAADSVFWFKGTEGKCIDYVWEVVHILRAYGEDVVMLMTDHPGRIVYEDEFQVAAIRFRDRAVTRHVIGAEA